MNEQNKYITKKIEIIKKHQTETRELKNLMNEMKNALKSIGNGANQEEERINELEDKNIEVIQVEEERELRFFFKVKKPQELSDSIRKANIRIMKIPKGEKEKGAESFLK